VQQVGAGDVARHQVGRELDAVEGQIQRLRQARDQQSLGESGHAHEQAVAAGQDREQELVDHLVLADDHAVKLFLHPRVGRAETL
jgi:hypothetical protein